MREPHPSAKKRRSLFRRLVVFAGIGVACLLAMYAGLFMFGRNRDEHRLREAIAEMDRLDSAWRLEDIEAGRVVLPDEQNSAAQVLKIKGMIPRTWPTRPTLPEAQDSTKPIDERVDDLLPEVVLSPEIAEELGLELGKVAAARDAAQRLADLSQGRYPVVWSPDWVNTNHSCTDAHRVKDLLRMNAALLAHDRQPDEAFRSSLALLNCGRSIGDEPAGLSQLVRVAIIHTTCRAIERTLAQSEPSLATLAALQRELEKEAGEPITLFIARGERAGQYRLMSGMSNGTARLSQLDGPSRGILDPYVDWQGGNMARRAIPKMLKYMTEFVEAAKLPVERQQEYMKRIDPKLESQDMTPEDIMLALLVPSFEKLVLATVRHRTVLHCAVVALAAERFRRDRSRWPTAIAEMTPQYLAAVPLDPFGNGPLRWRKDLAGVTVYSVGYDGVDNGGNLDRRHMTQPGSDIGFRLWDVSARRQEPDALPMPRSEGGEP